MKHYWPDVPGVGNVAVSRHAQARAEQDDINEHAFEQVLYNGIDTPDGQDAVWRQLNGVRLVIIVPTPFKGAKLVKTMFRVGEPARAHK